MAIDQWPDATSDSLEGVSSAKVPTSVFTFLPILMAEVLANSV